jgi:hypothetical protein
VNNADQQFGRRSTTRRLQRQMAEIALISVVPMKRLHVFLPAIEQKPETGRSCVVIAEVSRAISKFQIQKKKFTSGMLYANDMVKRRDDRLRFLRPVHIGDTIDTKIEGKNRAGSGCLVAVLNVTSQRGSFLLRTRLSG